MYILRLLLLIGTVQLTSAKSVNHPLVRMRNQEAQLIAEHASLCSDLEPARMGPNGTVAAYKTCRPRYRFNFLPNSNDTLEQAIDRHQRDIVALKCDRYPPSQATLRIDVSHVDCADLDQLWANPCPYHDRRCLEEVACGANVVTPYWLSPPSKEAPIDCDHIISEIKKGKPSWGLSEYAALAVAGSLFVIFG